MQPGDLVVLPLKTQPAVYIGEITGDYHAYELVARLLCPFERE